jgi:hypothetical protein
MEVHWGHVFSYIYFTIDITTGKFSVELILFNMKFNGHIHPFVALW